MQKGASLTLWTLRPHADLRFRFLKFIKSMYMCTDVQGVFREVRASQFAYLGNCVAFYFVFFLTFHFVNVFDSTRGLGKALAREFLRAGDNVVVASRRSLFLHL